MKDSGEVVHSSCAWLQQKWRVNGRMQHEHHQTVPCSIGEAVRRRSKEKKRSRHDLLERGEWKHRKSKSLKKTVWLHLIEEQSPSVEMAQRATTMYTDVCCSIHREEKLFSWLVNLCGSWAAVDPAGCPHACLTMCVGEGCFVMLTSPGEVLWPLAEWQCVNGLELTPIDSSYELEKLLLLLLLFTFTFTLLY